MHIDGEDEKNSLQRDLVSTLNTELRREAPEQKIEVRVHIETVTEAIGLLQAHAKARKIGVGCKALWVIWGNRVSANKFHPRITIVSDQSHAAMFGDFELTAQDISEINLPTELMNQPIYLTHFAAGYSFYNREEYSIALTHFEMALKRSIADSTELDDIRFYTGTSHLFLTKRYK